MSRFGAVEAALLGLGEGTKLRSLRSLELRGWTLIGATALCIALPGAIATSGNSAKAGVTLEERRLPMRFNWVDCQPNCRGWVSAVGIVTTNTLWHMIVRTMALASGQTMRPFVELERAIAFVS